MSLLAIIVQALMGNCLNFTRLCKEKRTQRKVVRVSSKGLTNVESIASCDHDDDDKFAGWCPCCKRPIDITFTQEFGPSSEHIQETGVIRYAYVAAIWGNGQTLSGFVRGALVLGASLKNLSSYDRVLMHTEDVPVVYLSLLEHVWTLKPVEYIRANSGLFAGNLEGHRFEGVFTKLHALNLLSYDKVLMMDIDVVIVKCPDELFKVNTPAAMRRGNSSNVHGKPMHGRSFFGGQSDGWSQIAGINAGIMLLKPNKEDFEQMLLEVCSERHPERIAGGGPEQDYLSRYYASKWHHISLLYNFQPHHVFYAMEQALKYFNGIRDSFDWSDSTGSSIEEAEEEARIGRGTQLCCNQVLYGRGSVPIYDSPFHFNEIGVLNLGDCVDALGRVVVVQRQWRVVPIRCHRADGSDGIGFVDCRRFGIVSTSSMEAGQHDEASDMVCEGIDMPMAVASEMEYTSDGSELTRNEWIPERLSVPVEDISIFHVSGVIKMWDRDYKSDETVERFAVRLLLSNGSLSPRLWLQRNGSVSDYAAYGIRTKEGGFDVLGSLHVDVGEKRKTIQKIISLGVAKSVNAVVKATKVWWQSLEIVLGLFGLDSVHELMAKLELPSYSINEVVDVYWRGDRRWYEGIIVHEDHSSNYLIRFDVWTTAWIHRRYLRGGQKRRDFVLMESADV